MRARRTSSLALVTIAVAIGTLTSSGAVADSVDVGSTPGLASEVVSCATGTTYIQDTATAPSYVLPAGVVTSWSVMGAAANPGTVGLRTAKEGPADTYTITGASQSQPLAAGRLNSFLTRIPVQAGNVLGIHLPPQAAASATCAYDSGTGVGDIYRYRAAGAFTDPVGEVIPTIVPTIGGRINISARVEPDADGDGYGDLTQDACPALKNSHDDCTPPNTFLKSGPSKKVVTGGSKAKVKISFFASEPATFTCQLDKATAKPCNGTFKAKVQPGKHKVSITATDQVGNVDATPLVVKFKVVRDQA
jgi:hypothetical protein